MSEEQKVLDRLLLDLSVRDNNINTGSGIGGNISELFFLITHKIVLQLAKENSELFVIDDDKIIFNVPQSADLRFIRAELTRFFDRHPDKKEISLAQMTSASFLKEQNLNTQDGKDLIRAVEVATSLSKDLDPKEILSIEIDRTFRIEYDYIKDNFLKEAGLPTDYFKYSKLQKLLDNPVWGSKYRAVADRHSNMCAQLLSQEDLDKLKMIESFPMYITLFVMRTIIGINKMVQLSLDIKCKSLSKIDSFLNSQ